MGAGTSVIEVFADVACPFAHVTLRRIVEERARLGRVEPRVRIRSWPLELVNDEPHDAAKVAAEVEALRRTVAPELFARFDPASFPDSTLEWLTLERAAYGSGDAVGERVGLRIRDAIFESPLSARAPDLARGLGIDVTPADRAAVEHDWRDGQGRGVLGSPHCFVGEESWFCPLFDVEERDSGYRITPAPERARAFLAACFAAGSADRLNYGSRPAPGRIS
jgi:predicted DsbA family dithiol-disulfide isomerase